MIVSLEKSKWIEGLDSGTLYHSFIFLFLELLFKMLLQLESDGKVLRIKVGCLSPTMTHLFFTDDILIFCKAMKEEVSNVFRCLNQYCDWTNQAFNLLNQGVSFHSLFLEILSQTLKALLERTS